ncbi:MAG: HD domain-containing protein [Blautia sp.]|nr:HD domain-containing protein [Blautia sp.]
MASERFEKQLAFCLELDKEKNVFRQTHLSGHGRRENDAEHAWHMALMAFLLSEYANEPVDIGKTMAMCLIHDVVEIDAGDTYAYDEAGLQTQREREERAKQRLFSLLPEDQARRLSALFEEFEEGVSPEARFAHAMDNLQPFILNDSNEGGDWVEHGVKESQILKRQEGTLAGSTSIWTYIRERIAVYVDRGIIRKG